MHFFYPAVHDTGIFCCAGLQSGGSRHFAKAPGSVMIPDGGPVHEMFLFIQGSRCHVSFVKFFYDQCRKDMIHKDVKNRGRTIRNRDTLSGYPGRASALLLCPP